MAMWRWGERMALRTSIDHLVFAVALVMACAAAVPSHGQVPGSQPATVILVRHAEPGLQPPDDLVPSHGRAPSARRTLPPRCAMPA